MKRMIDLKEFLQLQQLATNNEKRLDDIEGVYTYSNLAIDDGDFDFIDTSSPENFQPVSLAIGDHVYIDGEQTDLTAEMIAEIYDSNLVILFCGNAPTTYPNVILQRQFIDPASGALSPKSARFEAFVTLDSTVYHFTMIVTKYDSTSEEGGSIVIACTEDAVKPVYCHPISIRDDDTGTLRARLTMLIFNNDPTPFDSDKLKTFLDDLKTSTDGLGKVMVSGAVTDASNVIVASYLTKLPTNGYYIVGINPTTGSPGNINSYTWTDIVPDYFVVEDGVNRIN